MKPLLAVIVTGCMLCLGSFSVMAQKLDSFEKSAHKPTPPKKTQSYRHTDSCIDDFFSEMIINVLGAGIVYGGSTSWSRVSTDTDACHIAGLTPRENGDRQIPFARADFSYQVLGSDVDAYDYRVAIGYGPVSLDFDQAHYREDEPRDRLDLTRVHAMYRMSLGDHIEIDAGFGSLRIDGNKKDTRFSFTMPILIYPNELVGIEFRPAWASNVGDYDLAIMVGGKYSSFKAGYRWLNSPDESLHGPYVGLAAHF